MHDLSSFYLSLQAENPKDAFGHRNSRPTQGSQLQSLWNANIRLFCRMRVHIK